ncbi:sigma 54-interacting transcriptional regulator [Desulfobacula sp.]|uniref:sigma 54-interacting transcriptional regulator n=1 Tax=Desulfobacula sp. TaxID=2593537 RepID=UPI00262F1262|nr:sigma 54-interacting transcriptional regulator [Desulfobacula sp.]
MSQSVTQKTEFYGAWENFLKDGTTTGVRDTIGQSWKRCREYGVDPLNDISPTTVGQEMVTKRIEEKVDLHQLIQYHCQNITNETDLSLFNILFSDAEGYVLSIEGHDKILQISEHSTIKVGSNLSESSVGTTAPGISLHNQRPIIISGEEHYSKMFHWASCFAVPVFCHQNKILGCLNISTPIENRHKLEQLTLLFCSIASSFQFEFFMKKKFQELKLYSSYFDSTFKYADKNLILINKRGNIINLNAKAKKFFGINPYEIHNRNILGVLNMDSILFRSLLKSSNVQVFNFKLDGDVKRVSVEALPIFDPSGNEISYLLQFTQENKGLLKTERPVGQAIFTFENIIGRSSRLLNIVNRAKKAAKTSSNILIEGETGTGKELFAHSIHNASQFSKGPFVAINCSAIPNELIESELFGYEKGAYTGAHKSGGVGKFEMANRGTIFLDEIHTMSTPAQMKILRTIEDRTVIRVGGNTPISLSLRFIVASSENLSEQVEKGNFLSALFFRLNVVRLYIPCLKERKDDIALLVSFFIKQMNEKFHRSIQGIEPDALELMSNYSWPGNIRELKNCIESAFNFCEGEKIDQESLNLPIINAGLSEDKSTTVHTMAAVTRQMLSENLDRFGNVKEAANYIGIPVSTFYRKMKKFGLSK